MRSRLLSGDEGRGPNRGAERVAGDQRADGGSTRLWHGQVRGQSVSRDGGAGGGLSGRHFSLAGRFLMLKSWKYRRDVLAR